jgi:hypothetical protein
MSQFVRLQRGQLSRAAVVLAESFINDPATTYLFPDQRNRLAAMESIFGSYLHIGLQIGEVLTTPDVSGVAIWIRPDQYISISRTLCSSIPLIPLRFGFSPLVRMLRYSRFISRIHSRHTLSHAWYLFALGVNQAYRGAGVGSGLMQLVFQIADTDRTNCYLETNHENVKFYQKHGFHTVDNGAMSGNELPIWLMVREPNPSLESHANINNPSDEGVARSLNSRR